MHEIHYIYKGQKEKFNLDEILNIIKSAGDKVSYEFGETNVFNIKTGEFETKEAHIFTIDRDWNAKGFK